MRLMARACTRVTVAVCTASFLVVALCATGFMAEAREECPAALFVDLLNSARLDEGLDPYHRSRLLDDAANRHAGDLSASGFTDPEDRHLGSDGSSIEDRIREAGYAAWAKNGELVVSEIVWTGHGSPSHVLTSVLEDPVYREKLFSGAYREIGAAFATGADERGYFVLTFGARPNVLPIFINDGADSTENREVAIRLTNERLYPEGQGTASMGQAIEIRVSDEPTFEGLAWEPWTLLISWMLADTPGRQTVYVQYRDAARRTAAAADSIFFDTGTPEDPASPVLPTTPDLPVGPEDDLPPTPDPSSTGGEVSPGNGVSTATVAPVSPEDPTVTPFPTWTPLPSPEPTDNPPGTVLETPSASNGVSDYTRPLVVAAALQGVALFLGLYLLIRKGGITAGDQ